MTKKIIGICILLIIALGSGVYLAATRASDKNKTLALANAENISLPQTAEQLPKKSPDNRMSLILPNATQAFAAGLAKDIINKNPKGPIAGNAGAFINALDPDAAVNAVIKDAVANIGYETFGESVSFSELIITQDASLPALETYFSSLTTLLQATHKKMSSLTGALSPTQFATAGSLLNDLIAKLKNLQTPARVADIHKEQIELLIIERNIFEAISNANTDPVLSIAALQLLPVAITNVRALDEKFIAMKKVFGIK